MDINNLIFWKNEEEWCIDEISILCSFSISISTIFIVEEEMRSNKRKENMV